MSIPADLKYTKDHEWIKFDGEIATVRIHSLTSPRTHIPVLPKYLFCSLDLEDKGIRTWGQLAKAGRWQLRERLPV